MKPYATTLEPASSLSNHTGSWRTSRPVYVTRKPPCNHQCPAGENIQEWLEKMDFGDIEGAWRALVVNNPFPATMGRVCYHTCESVCNRKDIDTPVAINAVERSIGDEALKQGWKFNKPAKASGKKVLVVGAGPAGLSAAYQLASRGHKVTVAEAFPKAGGMMRYGIPRYRLPRKILDAEIARIEALGVKIETKRSVTDIAEEKKAGKFDAVFLSVGAHIGKTTDITLKNRAKLIDAVSFLHAMETTQKPKIGKRVVVYGGGNTAMDVARTAVRLGAKQVTVVYRRNREKMPAHAFEIDEAIEEGVEMKYLVTIKQVDGKTLKLEKMELDKSGFPQPTGKYTKMEADTIICALGQDADLALLDGAEGVVEKGQIAVDAWQRTKIEGVFAGGDAASSARTVTDAIGQGKKAAKAIDAFLRGEELAKEEKAIATTERLNKWYYAPALRNERKNIDLGKRKKSFDEVVGGLTTEAALEESKRCLSCGNCFECDTCFGVCPDNAIEKLGEGEGFRIKLDYCKGCGICVAECPCGAMDMKLEEN